MYIGWPKPSLKIRTASAIFWIYLGLLRDYGLKFFLLGIKLFLFFKIESWNFQYLFEIEFREVSQNFKSFSSFKQLFYSIFLSVVWMSWNFVRFHEILFQSDAESFSFQSWKTKKIFLKDICKSLSISKQKSFVYWPNFQWRFWGWPVRPAFYFDQYYTILVKEPFFFQVRPFSKLFFRYEQCKWIWNSKMFCEKNIFQTFWKTHSCTKFLFIELETSNFGYFLKFFAKLCKVWLRLDKLDITHFIRVPLWIFVDFYKMSIFIKICTV